MDAGTVLIENSVNNSNKMNGVSGSPPPDTVLNLLKNFAAYFYKNFHANKF